MANSSRDGYELAQQSHGSVVQFNDRMNSLENSAPLMIQHNPGISMDWTAEEQANLEEGLNTFGQHSKIVLYAKIAVRLPKKTVRDVALRVQWRKKVLSAQQRERTTKRKADNDVDKKEIAFDPSGKSTLLADPFHSPPYAQVIAGANGQLLQRNAMLLLHLHVNINSNHQIHRNIPLFSEVRDNILKVLNNMVEMPEAYKNFPPISVKLNEELANLVIPPGCVVSYETNTNYATPN